MLTYAVASIVMRASWRETGDDDSHGDSNGSAQLFSPISWLVFVHGFCAATNRHHVFLQFPSQCFLSADCPMKWLCIPDKRLRGDTAAAWQRGSVLAIECYWPLDDTLYLTNDPVLASCRLLSFLRIIVCCHHLYKYFFATFSILRPSSSYVI